MSGGLDILLKAYWSDRGWKSGSVSNEEFETAKNEGFMFDYPSYTTHDETIDKLNSVLSKISLEAVANAFLYSLSTRKLEYRSALGSFCYAKAIPKHKLNENVSVSPPQHTIQTHCYLCGWLAWKKNPNEFEKSQGLNIFNFERYKWGGVRHTKLDFALFDLEQFIKLPKVVPTDNDREILNEILKCVYQLEPHNKAGKLRDLIVSKKIFECNKAEVSIILDILGICGILVNQDYPSYEYHFTDLYQRDPIVAKSDFAYPVNRWSASDKINYIEFEKIFRYKFE